MNQSLHVVCPHCAGVNRVPAGRLAAGATACTYLLPEILIHFRRAHPLEHRYEAVHGADLFERAHELGALALNINPLGAVGGQLYALEIANMVTALRRWRAKHQH